MSSDLDVDFLGDLPGFRHRIDVRPRRGYFRGIFTPAVNIDSCNTTEVSFVPFRTSNTRAPLTVLPGLICSRNVEASSFA